jgi:hypothetical protein
MAHRPAARGDLPRVPYVQLGLLAEGINQRLMVGPADLSRQCLDFFEIRPQRGEFPHIEDVAAGEPPGRTGGRPEILGDASDDVIAPAAGLLSDQDVATDRPVQEDQLGVKRPRCARLRFADPALEAVD